ncbi:MAG: CHAD domain-containing protein [Solirubrobacteraceae bacterium]|jgi:CHAD domain-containing protein
MKARKIGALNANMGIAQAARRIIAVRSDEVFSLAPRALAGEDETALHDLRIAAKRLRYVLELVGFVLGDVAGEAETRMRDLQTLIGDVHDCDVLLRRLGQREPTKRNGTRQLADRLSKRRSRLFGEFVVLWSTIETSRLHERIVAATNHSPNDSHFGA